MISDLRISHAGLPPPEVGISKPIDASQFGDLFRDTVGEVDNLEQNARVAIHGLMSGTGADVHQALIASEKATAAFELALAMRNKAIQCYQAVMSMQF
jgi:flagellar hook-basal body complex protein FliE